MVKKDDLIGGVMLGVAIAGLGVFFLFAPSAPEIAFGPIEVTGSSVTALATKDSEVVVAGNVVRDGFITIHESIGGAPGTLIGTSALLHASAAATDVIPVTTPLIAGSDYVALLHVDNGDGVFVVADDMPVTSDGKSVRADFTFSPSTP